MFVTVAQNLCVTAAHCPIREILEKEKKVLFCSYKLFVLSMHFNVHVHIKFRGFNEKAALFSHNLKRAPIFSFFY